MKLIVGALAAAASMVPIPARAQAPSPGDLKVSCGEIQRGNTAYQYGDFGTWLEYIVSTTRTITSCPMSVSVAAHVVNVGQSAYSDSALFSAVAKKQVLVPYSGIWQTNGKHAFTYLYSAAPPLWWTYELVPTVSHTVIEARFRRDREAECYALGGEWDGWDCYIPNCPLIVDTARDGFRLTSPDDGVLFDLDADGVRERLAWTAADSDEAFLAMDRNGNGQIDDGTELFGNHTPVYPGTRITAGNGFDALAFTELPAFGQSVIDGLIDRRDVVFPRLLLWRDANHNGISEADELTTAGSWGLRAIATEYKTSRKQDKHGNEFRQRAKGAWADGDYFIYDVWLRRR
jgi:hypothetical protein